MKRLNLNNGRYQGETLNIAEYLREFHSAALARHWRPSHYATIDGHALHGYSRVVLNARKTIYISAGIHGDEPSGPVALRRLVEEDQWPADATFHLNPCLNPGGFAANTRENKAGIDLNRDYRHLHSEEVRAHSEWLKTLPNFDVTLILHEDWEADGYYVYEVNPDNLETPSRAVLDRVREVCPIQPSGLVDGLWDCVDGLIRPNLPPEERPLWAEAVYLIANKTRLSLTLESPSDFPLPLRVEAHARAIRTALVT